MPEPLLFAAVAILAAVVIAMPILLENPDRRAPQLPEEDRDALALRHRIAIEALRDVEADHRSGSLDEASYRAERALAEERAVATRAALDAAPAPPEAQRGRDARLVVGGVGITLGVMLAAGVLLGIPANLANATVTNQALADRMAQAEARQSRITELLGHLRVDPEDTDALSELADLYLASGTQADRNAAQTATRRRLLPFFRRDVELGCVGVAEGFPAMGPGRVASDGADRVFGHQVVGDI